MSASEPREPDTGAAGASARREHGRRRANRQQAVREKHPRTATLRLALASDPAHEVVWARGAAGEERVAAILAKHLHAGVVVRHDRRNPRTRANIDHIAVAPSGVWVIDAKRYKALCLGPCPSPQSGRGIGRSGAGGSAGFARGRHPGGPDRAP